MPIYEYRCKKNGHQFEVIQKLSDPPLKTCIHCRSKVEKLISASAFVLKGAGFYVNDYARKGDGGEKSEGKSGSKGEKASSDTKEPSSKESTKESAKESKEKSSTSDSSSPSKGRSSSATAGS